MPYYVLWPKKIMLQCARQINDDCALVSYPPIGEDWTKPVFRITRRSDGPDGLPTDSGFGDPLGPDGLD